MIFDLIENKPRITIEGIHIPEFRDIWEADESEDKIQASQTLTFIYHMADFASSYSKMPQDERKKELMEDYIHYTPTAQQWDEVYAAIDKYKRLIETPAMRLLEGARNAVHKFTEYFNNIDFEERDDRGRPVYSSKDLASNLEKIGKIVSSLEDLEKVVQKEQSVTREIRRGQKPSSIL